MGVWELSVRWKQFGCVDTWECGSCLSDGSRKEVQAGKLSSDTVYLYFLKSWDLE